MGYLVRRGSLGDWVAVYHDGIKLDEGHSLSPESVLRLVGVDVETEEVEQNDLGSAIDGRDAFPDTLP